MYLEVRQMAQMNQLDYRGVAMIELRGDIVQFEVKTES